jgi:enhancer of polycomb-like protein
VPAPPAEETKDIVYDDLYTLKFPKSSSYIRFSQTVEECCGCRYDMNSDDDVWLKAYNSKRPSSSQCSEDGFEKIMEIFESTAERQTPFAAVDNTVVGFDVMEMQLRQELKPDVRAYTKDIYEIWKTRRQCSSNRQLQPTLKFEIHQDSDEADPYVCFRRRDVRQTRKTRARDVQSAEKLKKLRKELEEGRQLVMAAHQREVVKRELLTVDRTIFEQRSKVKEIRQRLNIKGDDEDLINQKVWNSPMMLLPNYTDHHSHRRESLLRYLNCNVHHQASFVFQVDQMGVQLKWICHCFLMSSHKRRTCSRWRLT